MRLSFLSLALTSVLLIPAIAKADTFNFAASGSGGSYSGSGVLTGDSNGDGSFTLTGISGTGITALLPVNDFFGNDNLLFPSATRLVDVNGFAFTAFLNGLNYSVNLFSTVSGYEAVVLDSNGEFTDTPVTFSISRATAVTPEPTSLILLGTGLIVVAGRIRRRMAV